MRYYSPRDFDRFATTDKDDDSYDSDIDLDGGSVISLSAKLQQRLDTMGGGKHDDESREDSSVITAMLAAGHSPEDVYVTFAASARGEHARKRHPNFDDYMQRTIRNAVAFLEKSAAKTNGHVEVDFGNEHDPKANQLTKSGIIEERLDLIEPQKAQWVWKPYIPAGRISVLAGDPGMGKSQIAIDLVSRISRGAKMPLDEQRSQLMGTCAIATAEDHTAETIVPRIMAAHGDRKRIRVLRKVEIDGKKRYLSFPRDLEYLKNYIVSRALRMLVIDPLNSFLGASTDAYKDHDVRLALGPLEEIAEATGCSILVIAHLNKKEDSATLYRVSGSIGFVGAARSVLAVSRSNQDEDLCVLYSLKSNLAKRPPALEYALALNKELDVTHVGWLGASNFDPEKAGRDDGPQKMKECRDFLLQELADGEVAGDTVAKDMLKVGLATRTLKYYKKELGVESVKHGDKWYWRFAAEHEDHNE
jgi:DNA repair protein RadA/Sms